MTGLPGRAGWRTSGMPAAGAKPTRCRSSGREKETSKEPSTRANERSPASAKSLPSLLMVTRDLTKVLNDQYPAETQTRDYLDQITALTAIPGTH